MRAFPSAIRRPALAAFLAGWWLLSVGLWAYFRFRRTRADAAASA